VDVDGQLTVRIIVVSTISCHIKTISARYVLELRGTHVVGRTKDAAGSSGATQIARTRPGIVGSMKKAPTLRPLVALPLVSLTILGTAGAVSASQITYTRSDLGGANSESAQPVVSNPWPGNREQCENDKPSLSYHSGPLMAPCYCAGGMCHCCASGR
jgi:hypothetical protein